MQPMTLEESDIEFLRDHHSAAMITVTPSGVARTARVGVALVDDKLWCSGTQDRVRPRRRRAEPRRTPLVVDRCCAWLALHTTGTIVVGHAARQQNLQR